MSFIPFISYKNEAVFKDFNGITIARCYNCGLLKTITPKNVQDLKQSRGKMYEEKRDLFIPLFNPIVNEIHKYNKSGRILDVGCSSGLLLELLNQKGFEVYGIEPNKNAYNIANKKFKNQIYYGTLSDFTLKSYFYVLIHRSKPTFDVIIFNHVLEHIEKVHEQLEITKKLLKPDGLLVIGVPNTRNIIFYLRKKYWEYLMPKEHIWHFSDNYMTKLLNQHGFSVISRQYSNDKRQDYSMIKRIYFTFLTLINTLMGTGESVTLYCKMN
jgi:2-polyprenyl-3-methyl-5-hydroxy-6-metoxy-1,4-benzoquinol methylase